MNKVVYRTFPPDHNRYDRFSRVSFLAIMRRLIKFCQLLRYHNGGSECPHRSHYPRGVFLK